MSELNEEVRETTILAEFKDLSSKERASLLREALDKIESTITSERILSNSDAMKALDAIHTLMNHL